MVEGAGFYANVSKAGDSEPRIDSRLLAVIGNCGTGQ